MIIYPVQIVLIAALQCDKSPTKVLVEYADYANVFSLDLVIKLSENTNINKYVIKLLEGKKPTYRPIYAPSLI